jgi:hydrogenase nickel incorporation protein HypA/HybF
MVQRMHELGIATAALDQVILRARGEGARQVARIGLRVGVLSGVDPEALRFAFEAILPGTLAEGAMLDIETVAAIAHCGHCGRDFPAAAADACGLCATCEQPTTCFTAGRELEFTRLEII